MSYSRMQAHSIFFFFALILQTFELISLSHLNIFICLLIYTWLTAQHCFRAICLFSPQLFKTFSRTIAASVMFDCIVLAGHFDLSNTGVTNNINNGCVPLRCVCWHLNGAQPLLNVISHTCASPAVTSQKYLLWEIFIANKMTKINQQPASTTHYATIKCSNVLEKKTH